jgi:hypothetical protein
MKRLLALLLVMCLVFMAVGCSGGKDTGTGDAGNGAPVDDPGDDAAEEPVALSAFYEIEEIGDLVKSFKELVYSFSDAGNVLTVEYKYINQETVAGVNADHFSIAFAESKDTTEVEIWMDSGGEVVKAVFDGQEMGPMETPMAAMFLMVVLLPFSMYAGGWEDAFVSNNGYEQFGWAVSDRAKENRNFGAGTSTVHQYFFKVKSIENQELEYKFEVAEISGKSMFVGWEVQMDKENTSTFKVERVVPR